MLQLLRAAFGEWPRTIEDQDPAELFRWKHLASPFGRSLKMVAEADGALIGFAGWLRWKLTANSQTFEVLRAVDVAVDRAYRGRGVYAELVREATARFPPDAAFTLNTPNELSRRGSLKAGGRELGVFPLFVRVRAPVRGVVGLISDSVRSQPRGSSPLIHAESVADTLREGERVSALLSHIEQSNDRFATARDLDYLAWRYGTLRAYRGVREYRDGRLAGIAIFRVRPRRRRWMSIVCELLVAPGDSSTARRLLHRVAEAARVDYVVCHFPQGSAARQGAIRCGFLRVRSGPAPTVRQLAENIDPDPTKQSSWAISLGDLDLL